MANGDAFEVKKAAGITVQGHGFKLLDAAVSVVDGVWVDVRTLKPGSVEVSGTFVATVQLCGSNALAAPNNNAHGAPIGSNITAPGMVAVGMPLRWIKARVTAFTSGSINANFHSTT